MWINILHRFITLTEMRTDIKNDTESGRSEEYLSAVKGMFECCRIDMQ